MSAEIILEKIESLPSLSENVNAILDICDNPESSLNDLTEAIKKDPLITTNILKAANSPEYGYNQDIRDIGKAVTLFGMVSIKGFVMTTFVQGLEEIDLSPYNLDAHRFMELIHRQNAFVTNWYKQDREALELLSLTSHLMEVGKIILAGIVIDTSSQKLFAHHIGETASLAELIQMEKDIFDLSHEEVSGILMQKWGFPKQISEPLRYVSLPHTAPSEYKKQAYILHIAKSLINAHGYDHKKNLARAIAIVKKYHLKPESFVTAYKEFIRQEALSPA